MKSRTTKHGHNSQVSSQARNVATDEAKVSPSRHYSSFLVRFWTVNPSDLETEANNSSAVLPNPISPETSSGPAMVLQVQHLQTGLTWRLTNLEALNQLFGNLLENEGVFVSPDET